jgi:hypothetical protein
MLDYTVLPYFVVKTRKLALPRGDGAGKGNLCMLFSPSFEDSIQMMSQKDNCFHNRRYHFYYRQLKYYGKTANSKIYRIKQYTQWADIKNELQKSNCGVSLYPKKLNIPANEKRNMYLDLHVWWSLFQTYAQKASLNMRVKIFWKLFNEALHTSVGSYDNRFVLMDVSKFPFFITGNLKDRVMNPLYMILYTARKFPEFLKDINMDFVLYNNNFVMRIKPSDLIGTDGKVDPTIITKYLTQLKRLYRVVEKPEDELVGLPTDEEIKEADVEEKEEEEAEKAIEEVDKHPTKDVRAANPKGLTKDLASKMSLEKASTPKALKSVASTIDRPEEIVKGVTEKQAEAKKIVEEETKGEEVSEEEKDKAVADKTEELINEDKEILDEIYRQMQSKSPTKSQRSTARDQMLRDKQKEIVVRGTTIADLAKINPKEKQIESNDISKAMTTSNPNMKEIKFQNFNQSYIDNVMDKDITGVFENLNDKSTKMFIRNIKVEDTSDVLNYKETWTVSLEDENRNRHNIKVDIPKFYDKNFLWLSGNKKAIKNQLFFLPVVKIDADTVMIVTNYNKMTIKREEGKSLREIVLLQKQIAKSEELQSYFQIGSVFPYNKNRVTAVEYDEYSKVFGSFHSKDCIIYFNQVQATEEAGKRKLERVPDHLFVGFENDEPIWIDFETQRDEKNRSISDIIISHIPEADRIAIKKMQIPKRLMYTKITTMNQEIPMIVLMCIWEGLSTVLKKMGVKYRIEENAKSTGSHEDFIRFKNCYLIYDATVTNQILLNGFKVLETKEHNISEYDDVVPYIPFIQRKYGKISILNALNNVYEFTIGPIEKEILTSMRLPTDLVQLMVYANGLLGDNQSVSELDMSEYRVRCAEIIPAILYDCVAKAYVPYKNSNGKKKLSIPQDAVIKKLLELQTTEDASTLNPFLELETTHGVSTKGWRGVNLADSYTVPKRSYDQSMTGVIGVSSSPDGQVGVNRTLTMEPTINNVRGYVESRADNLDSLHDVNLFSPAEMLVPMSITRDDPIRTGHCVKQSRATIPIKDGSPVLISNGSDELCKYYLSSDFIITADDDGKVVEYDPSTKLMIVEYKNGKHRAINLDKNIVKNGGGGFELSNILITDLKVGDTFKKNDTLAWHKDYFKNIPSQGVRMNVGALIKVALYSTYNTYEDADFITHRVSDMCSTEMCFRIKTSIGKNSNIYSMVKVGQHVNVGDSLIEFDESFEDSDINKLLASLGENEELVETVKSNSRNRKKSKYSGVVEEIKIYSASEVEDLSPSLQQIVSTYYKKIDKKNRILSKYDKEGKTVKCGLMVTESSGRTQPDRYGNIRGIRVDDGVAIEFYIKHSEPLEVGSKVANYSALKNIVSEIIPEGFEPTSEFRPDESVDSIISPSSILNRMVSSIFPTMFGNKVIIELKYALKDIWEGSGEFATKRASMESLIYKVFGALDKTRANTRKYQSMFKPMSDVKFKEFFKEFFQNKDHYLILDIVDYERDLQIEDIEDAAKILKVPLYEHVAMPHLTMDNKNPSVTKYPIPVGYIHLKRPQQTVMKKNGMSLTADQRSAFTGQVTGSDKNGRESDLENCMLTSLGMKYSLKELNGPRADDSVMKREMLQSINERGYAKLEDLTDHVENKTTLNTVNTYFYGMGLHTDLVSKGLKLPYTIDTE